MTQHSANMRLCALGLSVLMAATTAQSSDSFTSNRAAEKVTQGKKTKAPKPTKDKSTGENSAQRDKRLLRECKGRPNAGACEGYAN